MVAYQVKYNNCNTRTTQGISRSCAKCVLPVFMLQCNASYSSIWHTAAAVFSAWHTLLITALIKARSSVLGLGEIMFPDLLHKWKAQGWVSNQSRSGHHLYRSSETSCSLLLGVYSWPGILAYPRGVLSDSSQATNRVWVILLETFVWFLQCALYHYHTGKFAFSKASADISLACTYSWGFFLTATAAVIGCSVGPHYRDAAMAAKCILLLITVPPVSFIVVMKVSQLLYIDKS